MGDHRVMRIRNLTMTALEIPFRQAFTHAAASRTTTEAVLVRAESARGLVGMGEGCPRSYVTGETVASALDFFCRYRAEWLRLTTVDDLQAWVAGHADAIDRNAAAWCAVELACLDLLGKELEQPIEVLLGGDALSGSFQYSAVLGAERFSSFEKQLHQYLSVGMTDFKIKVSGDFSADCKRLAAIQ
jgi:L-alanine-DL-glutamate epimerase-like enolase superfamily enzyme